MVEINSFYYTLSTIAQVLSGFIALSGVFAIFRLQEIEKRRLSLAGIFAEQLSEVAAVNFSKNGDLVNKVTELRGLKLLEQTQGMDFVLDAVILDERVINFHKFWAIKFTNDRFNSLTAEKKIILKLTKVSVMLGVITIILSLLLLGTVTFICPDTRLTFLIIGIIGSSISIGCMTRVIYLSFREIQVVNSPTEMKKARKD